MGRRRTERAEQPETMVIAGRRLVKDRDVFARYQSLRHQGLDSEEAFSKLVATELDE